MRKITVMYLLIIAAGSIGMLLPSIYVSNQEKNILKEQFVYTNTQQDVLLLQDIKPSDEALPTSEMSDDATAAQLKELFSRLIYYNYFDRGSSEENYKNLLMTKNIDSLMEKVKTILSETDSFANTDLAKYADTKSKTDSQLMITSFYGLYSDNIAEFYEVEISYTKDNASYSLWIVADAVTNKIYRVDGSLFTELTTDAVAENYRSYLGITRGRYENYSYSATLMESKMCDGGFTIEVYLYQNNISLRVCTNENMPPQNVPTKVEGKK